MDDNKCRVKQTMWCALFGYLYSLMCEKNNDEQKKGYSLSDCGKKKEKKPRSRLNFSFLISSSHSIKGF